MESKERNGQDGSEEEETPASSSNCINVEMLPCKLTFFCNSAALSSVFPFLNLFYVSSGLSTSQAGICSAIENCFSMFAVPMWGAFIDKTKHHKPLLVLLVFLTTITKFAKPWVVYFIATTTTMENVNSTVKPNITGKHALPIALIKVTNPTQVLIGLMISGVLSSIFYSGVMSYTEGTTVKVIYSRRGTKPSYGAQKVLAPIGFAVGSFIAGLAVDHYHPSGHLSHITAAFYVYLPFKLLLLPLLYILTVQADWSIVRQAENKQDMREALKKNAMFLLSIFIAGVCLRVYTEFSYLFIHSEFQTNKTLMSLTMVVAMVSECIVYPISGKIITACGGPIPCVIMGIFFYFPRYMLMSYCKNKWLLLPLQLPHGINMALLWASVVQHTYQIFPKSVTTTALGLSASLHFIISSVFTNLVGGALFQRFGGRLLFRGAAILALAWTVVMVMYYGIKRCTEKKMEVAVKKEPPVGIDNVCMSKLEDPDEATKPDPDQG